MARPLLPLLLLLFAGSGCAALIYEIVWFQLLELVIGSSALSLGLLLATFMGGMCGGSIALPRVVTARRHPLRAYALLELVIGICGIAVLAGIDYLQRLHTLSALCLLLPTLMMGASLPAMSRWVETTPRGVSWLGFFYGANIAGAVFGCLLAGFYLLRVHDVATATYVAAAINGAVALIGLGVAQRTPNRARAELLEGRTTRTLGSRAVYAAIALSGLCALGAEVIWTRLLSLMLGATVYTFSIILAVFLTGLGLGSGAGAFLARTVARPRAILGLCQLLLTAAVAWTAYLLANSLPYWPVNASPSPWLNFLRDLGRCAWAVLPATLLWGASFPLALAAAASAGQDPAKLAGGIYAANTAGAIAGAIGFSIVLIPWAGTQQCQRMLIGLSAAAAALLENPRLRSVAPKLAMAGVLLWSVPKLPWAVVAFGRHLPITVDTGELLYLGEGRNASIAVSELRHKTRFFHTSGKVEASTEPEDMQVEHMLGHIPARLHTHPRTVLVVGCGTGITAGSFVDYPSVERIVVCEIEPLVPPAAARYFAPENHDVLRDRRTEVVYDDARHYILTTRDKFDIITSDPIHPWVKGAATLYTKEYFELCRKRLNPGGVMAQWAPLYESDPVTVKSELATFFEVFPSGTIWGNDIDGEGYDLVLVSQDGARDMPGTYVGRGSDLKRWLARAPINHDQNLRLQYLAGLGLNSKRGALLYDEILRLIREESGQRPTP